MKVITPEEKVADKMVALLSDIRLDLDMLGLYLAKMAPLSFFLRSQRVYESAEEHLNGK